MININEFEPVDCKHLVTMKNSVLESFVRDISPGIVSLSELMDGVAGKILRGTLPRLQFYSSLEGIFRQFPNMADERFSQIQVSNIELIHSGEQA
jgi:hypothetical protein